MKRAIPLSTSSIWAAIAAAAAAALATIALVLIASGNSALAASSLVNGNFETGDLTGWSVDKTSFGGDASAVTSYDYYYQVSCTLENSYGGPCYDWQTMPPKEGSYFALLKAGKPSEYTKIIQPFKASKGDKVSGWAFFQTHSFLPYDDKGQVVVKSASGTTVATPFEQSVSSVGTDGNSGWKYWEHTFTDVTGEGDFQIEARVGHVYTYEMSVMGLDDVKTSTNAPDATDPDTTIGSTKPADPTNNTSASFSFSSSESSSTFQCKLDNGTYGSCSSPKQYTGLAQGSHTFSVKAIDQAGNEDETPASYTWTVDTTAPTVSTVSPANLTTGVARSTNATATFSEKMGPTSITKSTFKLYKCPSTTSTNCTTQVTNVTVSPSNDGLSATLDPYGTSSTLLASSTRYKAVVTTGAKDVAGNALNQQKNWYFTTGSK